MQVDFPLHRLMFSEAGIHLGPPGDCRLGRVLLGARPKEAPVQEAEVDQDEEQSSALLGMAVPTEATKSLDLRNPTRRVSRRGAVLPADRRPDTPKRQTPRIPQAGLGSCSVDVRATPGRALNLSELQFSHFKN